MAPPFKKVDKDLVEKLAQIHCTNEEIALICGVSADTIERRCAGIIKRGRANGRASLRRMQYKKALEGNPAMLIWLGKQILGQRDMPEINNEDLVGYVFTRTRPDVPPNEQ